MWTRIATSVRHGAHAVWMNFKQKRFRVFRWQYSWSVNDLNLQHIWRYFGGTFNIKRHWESSCFDLHYGQRKFLVIGVRRNEIKRAKTDMDLFESGLSAAPLYRSRIRVWCSSLWCRDWRRRRCPDAGTRSTPREKSAASPRKMRHRCNVGPGPRNTCSIKDEKPVSRALISLPLQPTRSLSELRAWTHWKLFCHCANPSHLAV